MTRATGGGSNRVVKVTKYEIYTGDVSLGRSFLRFQRRASREVEGAFSLPEDLELVAVDVDDSRARIVDRETCPGRTPGTRYREFAG